MSRLVVNQLEDIAGTNPISVVDIASSVDLAASSGASLVGYLPAGTGAVVTDVQTQLRRTIYAENYGVTADGTTNDTAAIQATFNAASLFSATEIVFPQGTILIKNARSDAAFSAALVASGLKNCVVRGSGNTKFIVAPGGGVSEFALLRVEQCTGVRFTGFEFDGSGITTTGSSANRSNSIICANFDVNNPSVDLPISNSMLEFDRLYLHDVGGGITVARRSQTLASTPFTENVSVHDCRMKNLLGVDHGVSLPCTRVAHVYNNRFWNEIETVTIQDNMAVDASSESQDVLVENNYVRGFVFGAKSESATGAGPSGTEVRSSKRVYFVNNTFEEIGHPTYLVWPGPSGGDTYGIKLNSQDSAAVSNSVAARTIGVTTGGLSIGIAVVNTHGNESHAKVADNRVVGAQYNILHNDAIAASRLCSVTITNNRSNDAVLYGILAQGNATVTENTILRAGRSAILCQVPNNSFFRKNLAIDCASTTNTITGSKVVFYQEGTSAFSGVMEWSDNIIMDSRGASAANYGYFLHAGAGGSAVIFKPGYTTGLATAITWDQYPVVWGDSMQRDGTLTPAPRTIVSTNSPMIIAPWNAKAWNVGDRAVFATPTIGSPKAWVCTVSGTPGTWVSEGNL